jgi:NAD(P)-dependent dehydrogenase (short-subunit alcohol dehydrogenase family)
VADTSIRRSGAVEPAARGKRVLHVTESLGAGVGLSMSRLVELQGEAGAEVVVLATRRYDTPDEEELRRWVGPKARLVVHPGGVSSRAQLVWLARHLLTLLRTERFDALHLHSSFAGVVGRTVPLLVRRRPPTFYSPHGFAFLRQDLSARRRAAVRLVERVLARLGGRLVLVSESEAAVAEEAVGRPTSLLPNVLRGPTRDCRRW